ncbi:WD40-like Beta Propeller Repeat [Pedococcus dokdonensis]|uniref:WD40-like Beta Propeller Repeat n=1 Tax=Pedococcus dokdonensis TaxID=443156 RepID=A0A1H0MLQ0_9MICO|nr:WD40 repeat domain-containing protein [Pedococcus dokdonensis]SDO81332.1 WD40-like Beta Propeller Repeat [Pedococcus dokdonensis]
MSVDDLARTAAQQLRAATEKEVEPMAMLTELHHTRSRRRMTVGASTLILAVAVITAVAFWGPGREKAQLPAGTPSTAPTARGEVLLLQTGGTGRTQAYGGTIEHVPVSGTSGLLSLSFAPDGQSLAYVWSPGPRPGGGRFNGEVRVLDQQSGADRALGPCRFPCPVTWSPDGRGVLTSGGGGLRRYDVSTGSWTQVAVPSGWVVDGLDVSGAGRVAISGSVEGQPALMAVDLDGRSPEVVARPGAKAWVTEPRWSPDGRTLAYVHRAAAFDDMTADADISLRTVSSDGSGDRVVATLGHCVCGGVLPGMDWSPDGHLAVAMSAEPFQVFTVTLDGTMTDIGHPGGGPVAWRPAG